jgi:hypothetical protein
MGRLYHLRDVIQSKLAEDQSLQDLAQSVKATDARVLWHLERMVDEGQVELLEDGMTWHRLAAAVRCEPVPQRAPFPTSLVEDFEDAYHELEDGLYGSDPVQASGQHHTRLSSLQAAEFQARLLTLVGEYFAPGKGDRTGFKYGFHWVLTPIDLHPLEDL